MRTTDFDFDLPSERIAQTPADPRDSSRLLHLDRASGERTHHRFSDLPQLLQPSDLLILNNTKVFPARLYARKKAGGGKVELLLLRPISPTQWEALVGGRGLKPSRSLLLEQGIEATVLDDLGEGRRLLDFSKPVTDFVHQIGHTPLPPYIHKLVHDPQHYQTVFAQQTGSAAAPTAGLHFTEKLLESLRKSKLEIQYITLHIGLDTFAPIREDDPKDHHIHTEWCQIPERTAASIRAALQMQHRVIAVGTSVVRTLEAAAHKAKSTKLIPAYEGWIDLFILPGHEFQIVDGMITNFHLPKSSLLMLVSAFAGMDQILESYRLAIQEGYRFYSFGDAMLID